MVSDYASVSRILLLAKSEFTRNFTKMVLKIVVIVSLMSFSLAQNYYEIPELELIQRESIIKPLRVRRQILYGGLTPANPGATATVGAKGRVFNDNGYSINAHGQVSKTFKPIGPTSLGGGLDYQGPKAGVSGNVNHVRHFGTDVGVSGNANIWKSRNGHTKIEATGGFNRHYGGPSGNSRPNFNVGANLQHRF